MRPGDPLPTGARPHPIYNLKNVKIIVPIAQSPLDRLQLYFFVIQPAQAAHPEARALKQRIPKHARPQRMRRGEHAEAHPGACAP